MGMQAKRDQVEQANVLVSGSDRYYARWLDRLLCLLKDVIWYPRGHNSLLSD